MVIEGSYDNLIGASEMVHQGYSVLRSPIWWFGGKAPLSLKIRSMMPKTEKYIELFAGAASVFFTRVPVKAEILNDIDKDLMAFYTAMQNPETFNKIYRMMQLTPYSREEYYFCRDNWNKEPDMVKRIHMWFVTKRMSFSGEGGPKSSWSVGVSRSARGMAAKPSAHLGMIATLPKVHTRLQGVTFLSQDFREVIKSEDSADTLFYMDPPYMHTTRSGGSYRYELANSDHEELIDMLTSMKGKVIISCYDSPLYMNLRKHGWNRTQWKTSAHAAGRTRANRLQGKGVALEKQPRIETVYFNYNL